MNLHVVKRLGSGGFGIVDLVQDQTGRQFARKTFATAQNLPPALIDNVRRRFAREAKTQLGIRHVNIVSVVHAELSADPPWYLMPAAVGSLQDDLDRDKTLSGNWMAAIADIVAALDEMHQMRIYHRDLKPQNVLRFPAMPPALNREFYAVSDFGLIALNETRVSVLTMTGMAKNTDYYTAPEITSDLKAASAQSDIYSLGCILHEIVGTGPRVPCAEIKEGGDYGPILRNCTRTDPARRFRSVRSVLDALSMVRAQPPAFTTTISANFGDRLVAGENLDEPAWRALIDFVEDNEGTEEAKNVLARIAYDQAVDLATRLPDLSDRLGAAYARWVHNNAFPFDWCDRLANVLEVFATTASYETRADSLMAMLEMGTSHNRWFVERKFVSLCSLQMEETLAKRIAVEFRAAGSSLCSSIQHLEASIGISRRSFHPVLAQTLNDVCP